MIVHTVQPIDQQLVPVRISHDLRCPKCDFDLKGLIEGNPCPRCSTIITPALSHEDYEHFVSNSTIRYLPITGHFMLALLIAFVSAGFVMLFYGTFLFYFVLPLPIASIALTYSFIKYYSRVAILFDWPNEYVTFEYCFRSRSHWLSLIRMKAYTCSYEDILEVERVQGDRSSRLIIYTTNGIAILPDCMDAYPGIENRLRFISSRTEDAPKRNPHLAFILGCILAYGLIVGLILLFVL